MLERGEIDAGHGLPRSRHPSRLVKAVHDAGGELYSWTVDDAHTIIKLSDMGVDGIVSNDPRLFDDALADQLDGVAATA